MRIVSLVREQSGSPEKKIVMECYLLSEPKIRWYSKRMLGLWLQKGMFWVSEQRLVDQANSWMTKLEIEDLERKVTGRVIVSKQKRQEVLGVCLIM